MGRPPTDQLREGVDRVVKILKDPELRGDKRADERRAAVSKIADEIFDFAETAKRSLGQHCGRSERPPSTRNLSASSPTSSSARTSPRWSSTTPR
jgi:hypothetical protein